MHLKIIKTNLGEYYFSIPRKFEDKESAKRHRNLIALDPGIKTFLTGYDIKGNAIKLNDNTIGENKLYKVKQYIHKLFSILVKKIKGSTKRNIKKMYNRIDNLRYDMHHKISKFLCKRYKINYTSRVRNKRNDFD